MKVLIVEDDPLVASTLRRLIKRHGMEVLDVVPSIEHGAAKLRECSPDVLLLDREVEDGIGWKLKELAPASCRVVLMSGNPPANSPPHYVKGGDISILLKMLRGEL